MDELVWGGDIGVGNWDIVVFGCLVVVGHVDFRGRVRDCHVGGGFGCVWDRLEDAVVVVAVRIVARVVF